MRSFAEAWPREAIVQQPVAQLPWGLNVTLLEKLSAPETRLWYAAAAVEHGWSRNVLVHQIETRLHVRSGRAISNFKAGTFDPEYLGQLGMYMAAVDDLMAHPDDKPTIGLLLCKTKNTVVAEYALRGYSAPIGVAEWKTQIMDPLPEEFHASLSSIELLEAELGQA